MTWGWGSSGKLIRSSSLACWMSGRWKASSSIQGLPNELVSNSMNRQDVARISWRHLQFVPELGDVVVHRARQRKHIVAPDLFEQLIAGYDLSFMENQESQCFKFTR